MTICFAAHQSAAKKLTCHHSRPQRHIPCIFTPFKSSFKHNASTLNHAHKIHRNILTHSSTPDSLSLSEIAALDELIDVLLDSENAEDLSKKVADNILSMERKFWLRLATRADTASSEEQKEKLASLARVVMQLVDAMVRKTNEQLTDSAIVLQDILRAAADEVTGEWTVPLPPEKVAAMKAVMDQQSDKIDEALLSNCFAWMRKASDDKLDGMVEILRKVLQLYAARAVSASVSQQELSKEDSILADILKEDEGAWAILLRKKAQAGEISEVSFLEALQRKMESVVLGLSSGSYAQRVQAEYLKELESRAKGVFADIAQGR